MLLILTITPSVEKEIKNFLKEKKEQKGRNFFTTTSRITKEIDMTPQMVGRALHNLNEKGIVKCVKESKRKNRYKTQF